MSDHPENLTPAANLCPPQRDEPLTAEVRTALLGQRGAVIWLTGLSGAGKSTLSEALERRLLRAGILPVLLDGDELRTGLCVGLGFSESERKENIRRAAEAALLVAGSGAVVIVALISPYRSDRDHARARCAIKGIPFAEVYINAPLAVCEERDPKHLYARARAGEIQQFTGITAPYEPPLSPTLELHTDLESIDGCVAKLEELAISMARPDRRARYVSQLIGPESVLQMQRQPRGRRMLKVFVSTFEAVLRSFFRKLGR
jgi:adenylyl-sulfate kinase